jgi:hypothetical protein
MTLAEHANWPGDFTQIVYFTSEQDPRRFEQEPLAERRPRVDRPARRMTGEPADSRCPPGA